MAEHTQPEVNRALEVAKKWQEKTYPEEIPKDIVFKYVNTIFALWKAECGEVRKGDGGFSELLGIKTELVTDEDERWNLLKNMEPWECMPQWSRQSPIDLLIHIWASDYPHFNSNIFYNALAWLVIDCIEKNNPNWNASIISAALMLADLQCNINDRMLDTQKELIAKQWPKAKAHDRQFRGIVEAQEKIREASERKQMEFHNYADVLLSSNKPKRNVIGIIATQTGMDKRTIRRHLENHPSGNWIPKSKKSDSQ